MAESAQWHALGGSNMSEPSSSARLRAATDSQRESNDRLAKSLGLNPLEGRVHAAEREAVRLVRLLARAPDARTVLTQLHEAAHNLLDADVGLAKSRGVK
jgi:hypothetical protein